MTDAASLDTDPFWKAYGAGDDYEQRLGFVAGLVPEGTDSIADIGCGKGDVLNALLARDESLELLGVDISSQALSYVNAPTRAASLPDLPLPDDSFDLVICLQVLEHLDQATYTASLRELERVASRHLIIGVPFRENLRSKMALCARCGRPSHVDHHLRSFDIEDLSEMFEGFALDRWRTIGVVSRREPDIASLLRQRLAGRYNEPDLFACPFCGASECVAAESDRGVAQRLPEILGSTLTRLRKPLPYWLIGRFHSTDA